MHTTIMILLATLRETFLSRASLHLENLALRQQVAILKRERRRPWLQMLDRWHCQTKNLAIFQSPSGCWKSQVFCAVHQKVVSQIQPNWR